jgi:hypothetical protein
MRIVTFLVALALAVAFGAMTGARPLRSKLAFITPLPR